MNWRYKVLGGHTHVRVFMNGAKCGDLCFRNEEFEEIKHVESSLPYIGLSKQSTAVPLITFVDEAAPE